MQSRPPFYRHFMGRICNIAFEIRLTFTRCDVFAPKKRPIWEDIPDSCWVHDCLFRSDRKTDYSVLNSKLIFVPSLTLSSALAPMRMAGFYVRQKFSESTI